MSLHRTLPLVLVVIACGCSDRKASPPVPKSGAKPALEHASQNDLARELEAADRDGSWQQVQARWQGQTLRWTVTRQRALCQSPDACNVQPFPVERPAKHGWLPEVTFDPAQFAKLEAACGAAAQCEVTLEGVLRELVVSPDMPTNLHITNATVIRAVPTTIASR